MEESNCQQEKWPPKTKSRFPQDGNTIRLSFPYPIIPQKDEGEQTHAYDSEEIKSTQTLLPIQFFSTLLCFFCILNVLTGPVWVTW